ncbi:MAG: SH3 domain-containing protein [Anaerolineaceae bacterium]|nr:SH3 domain-containing protein [Anaerolineaceae bacterium]
MRNRVGLILGIGFLLVWGAALVVAQTDTCDAALETLWVAASDTCISAPVGYICNGGSAPQSVEPAGPVSNALASTGALVEIALVDAVQTPPILGENNTAGILWLRPDQPIRFTGLALGEVRLQDVTPPDFPAWQSMVVETLPQAETTCATTPPNLYIAQTPFGEPTNIVINGVSISLNGTILVVTRPSETVFAGLSGQAGLFAVGQNQLLRTGQQISIPYNPDNFATPIGAPSIPASLTEDLAPNLPTALLDRPVIIPQPGYVTTQGDVNMRAAPTTDAALLLQVPAGEVMSVLGRNPAGDWYHVRLDSGETGWMYAPLLLQFVGTITAVYEATPLPPQRYGTLGTSAKVLAPAGVNLRAAPDVSFAVLAALQDGTQVTLLARSPYSPWVKVDAGGGLIGWLALITIETQAVLEALPIDYDVPPPPLPTQVPGSFGNAFPDPNKNGN